MSLIVLTQVLHSRNLQTIAQNIEISQENMKMTFCGPSHFALLNFCLLEQRAFFPGAHRVPRAALVSGLRLLLVAWPVGLLGRWGGHRTCCLAPHPLGPHPVALPCRCTRSPVTTECKLIWLLILQSTIKSL